MIRKSSTNPDFVASIEACYRVEQSEGDWLLSVLESLSWLEQGLGMFAFTYRLSDELELLPGSFVQVGCPPEVQEALSVVLQNGPEFNRVAYQENDIGAASEFPGFVGSPTDLVCRSRGVFDSWGINGRNLDQRNVIALAMRTVQAGLPSALRALLGRLSIHIAAGERLRRRLQSATAPAEVAILSPSGRVEYAIDDAREPTLLREISTATQSMVAARSSLRDSPESAMGAWKGRVATRFTLVDRYERDGKRFIVACENAPRVSGDTPLSARERQVVASAALGRTNKEIAYDLGLADSTVRVLLARAGEKLGTRKRSEIIARFRKSTSLGTPEPGWGG